MTYEDTEATFKTWVDLSAVAYADFDMEDAHHLADHLEDHFSVFYDARMQKWLLVEQVGVDE